MLRQQHACRSALRGGPFMFHHRQQSQYLKSSACMQVIEHDDEETHASFSPLSTGASLRSFPGTPFAAARNEEFCSPSREVLGSETQGGRHP